MLSLYRRHRPRTFDSVVGQEHIVKTLRNAIALDKVHHAYLFVGSRGTGKTSMAKLLACALNAEGGANADFDPATPTSKAILAGTSLDVVEMDAASNNSVDDIRELRENVALAPMQGGKRVYILDEAHMLTTAAWNAFLKTLEEPPAHVVFVLATTEAHKVPATIIDRCHRFDFQRPSLEQIAEVVRRVADAEGIVVEDGAMALIARSASGSFRDALGTLDQLVAFGGDKVETHSVVELLGAADAELLFETTDAIGSGDAAGALEAIDRLARSGRDPGQFARDLIAHLRQLLVARATGDVPESFTVTVAQPDRLAEQAGRIGEAKLMGAIDALSVATANMREGDDPRLSLEVALLKVTRPALDSSQEALLRRIEALESGQGGGAGNRSPEEPSPNAGTQPQPQAEPSAAEPAEEPKGPVARATETATAVAASIEIERVTELWPAVVDHVRSSGSEMLSSLFDGSRPLAVDTERSVLKVGFPASAKFNKRKAEAQANVERIAESVKAIVGERLRPVYELIEVDEGEAAAAANGAKPMAEEEIIELIKTKFDAREVADEAEPEARESEAG